MQAHSAEQTNAIAAAVQKCGLDVLTLWAAVRGYAYRKARRWAAALEHRSGQDVEDLMQEAFLAMLRAVGLWEQYKGMGFIGVYELTLRDGFSRACGCRTKREAEDPLRSSVSLDAPVAKTARKPGRWDLWYRTKAPNARSWVSSSRSLQTLYRNPCKACRRT